MADQSPRQHSIPHKYIAVQSPSVQSPSVQSPSIQSPIDPSPNVQSPNVQSPSVLSPSVQSPSTQSPSVKSLHARQWKSLDFGGGAVRSTVGSSPDQKLAKKLLKRSISSPSKTRSKRKCPDSSPLKVGSQSPPKKQRGKRWTDDQTSVLLQFTSDEGFRDWPQSHCQDSDFWDRAVQKIKEQTGFDRKANAVRTHLTKTIKDKYESLLNAFERYDISYREQSNLPDLTQLSAQEILTVAVDLLMNMRTSDKVTCIKAAIEMMNIEDAEEVANMAFFQLALKKNISSYPTDFAKIASDAMATLQECNKPNILYNFAKCLGTNRPGTTSTLMPINRMPFGLIEYQIQFFSCTNTSQLKMPSDFRQFHQMMAVEFGERFTKLFRGPGWSGVNQEDHKDPYKARINVACLGHRTIMNDLKESEYSTEPEIQTQPLRQLKDANPDGNFWVKADGTDIKGGLQESMTGKWNGDVNLLDGTLEEMRAEYERRRDQAKRAPTADFAKEFEKDILFLNEKLQTTAKAYEAKYGSEKSSKSVLKDMNWELIELIDLIDKATAFNITYSSEGGVTMAVHEGLAEDLRVYLRDLFMKKRERATHVMVFMVSEERRAKKPYALPVLYVPYRGMTAENMRRLTNMIKEEMENLDMAYAGLVTDGEFNTLRRRGDDGIPVHLYQVIQDVRSGISRLKENTLEKMFTKCGEEDGKPLTENQESSLPDELINKLDQLRSEGNSLDDALTIVRSTTVPDDYTPETWNGKGKKENTAEKMRSLLLTYRYKEEVQRLKDEDDRDFTRAVYVPEVDKKTKKKKQVRADHNHLVKRITAHTRDGGPRDVNVKRYEEAMKDDTTDLNLPALMGLRKQSTVDAEKFLSHLVADFFERKGYKKEAFYTRTVANWHEATDGRGMSQLDRKKANEAMMEMVMNEWMPWHDSENPDLSEIDVNVRAKGVCGFSAETMIEVTTNIVSQELRREETATIGYPEHPRASTTDDSECFFALLHRITSGQHVTLADFKYRWRRLVLQFNYRMDNDLPFYVWTLNERFTLDEQPSFDEVPDDEDYIPRLHCLTRRRREECSTITGGRSMMPIQHMEKIRRRQHRRPMDVADVPEEFATRINEVVKKSRSRTTLSRN